MGFARSGSWFWEVCQEYSVAVALYYGSIQLIAFILEGDSFHQTIFSHGHNQAWQTKTAKAKKTRMLSGNKN